MNGERGYLLLQKALIKIFRFKPMVFSFCFVSVNSVVAAPTPSRKFHFFVSPSLTNQPTIIIVYSVFNKFKFQFVDGALKRI